jgi:hypothetical protein
VEQWEQRCASLCSSDCKAKFAWKWGLHPGLHSFSRDDEEVRSRWLRRLAELLRDSLLAFNDPFARRKRFRPFYQHDAEELLTAAISKYGLYETASGTQIFGRIHVTRTRCNVCKSVSTVADINLDNSVPHILSLVVDAEILEAAGLPRGTDSTGAPTVHLEQVLARENLKDNLGAGNEVVCARCKKKQQVTVFRENLSLPQLFLVMFKRDPNLSLVRTHVLCPQRLRAADLGFRADDGTVVLGSWEAVGISVHIGHSKKSGHYMAKVRAIDEDDRQRWCNVNDKDSGGVSLEDLVDRSGHIPVTSGAVYMILYRRKSVSAALAPPGRVRSPRPPPDPPAGGGPSSSSSSTTPIVIDDDDAKDWQNSFHYYTQNGIGSTPIILVRTGTVVKTPGCPYPYRHIKMRGVDLIRVLVW